MALVRVFSSIVWLATFLGLLLLAIKNAEPVPLRFYFGLEWNLPLILVLLLVFAIGAVLGLLACLPAIVRQRREIARLAQQMTAPSTSPAAALLTPAPQITLPR